ncbi:hypothetical protein [Methylobacterium cerastii]|uniref:hypothetical protein n=1 Tax=Methylobacterium cerastii TaxID=932741 RepID=UPI001EE2A5DA|nr:hypothetical protein [Methylobacterium cerastii]
MSGSAMLKLRSTPSAMDTPHAPMEHPQAIEMATLRQRLLDRRRPGAHLAIKRMEKLDQPLADLKTSAANLNITQHNNLNSLDPMLRRMVFLKANDVIAKLVDIMRQVANINSAFDLTEENTQLLPEDPILTQAYEEVSAGILEDIQYERDSHRHLTKTMFEMLDFMVDAHLKGDLIKI